MHGTLYHVGNGDTASNMYRNIFLSTIYHPWPRPLRRSVLRAPLLPAPSTGPERRDKVAGHLTVYGKWGDQGRIQLNIDYLYIRSYGKSARRGVERVCHMSRHGGR